MDTMFINSENSETSDPHRLGLADKMDFCKSDRYLAFSNLMVY